MRDLTLFHRCAPFVDVIQCLQDVDLETFNAVNDNIALSGFFGTFVFVPVVDGTFIVERPIQTIQKGHINAVCLSQH